MPVIGQIVPQTVSAGAGNATVEVVGSNFTDQTVVLWNGSELTTTVINNTTLAGTVDGSNLTVPGTAELQLQNNITGQRSAPVPIKITSPTATSPLTMTTTSLPSATLGAPYSVTLAATGGTPAYTWKFTSGKMPTGLSLSTTGVLSGTPSASGTFSLGITVSDKSNPVQQELAVLSLAVSTSPVSVTTTSLPSATYGTPYSQTLQASGGTPAYNWSITSGRLPVGLTLTNAGVISGTPTASGTSSFTATVRDSGNPVQTQSVTLSIAIAATPLKITTSALASGTIGGAYSQSLSASGGTPGYTWSLASGSLPTGLTLTSTGAISGTPTAAGTSSFTATVRDSGNPVQTQSVTLSIAIAATPLKITASTLAQATDGRSYMGSLQVTGGTPGYTWSIASGSLPAGLTLASTGAISGTPTASGSSTFTASVSDSGSPVQTISATFTITVAPTPITITASTLPTVTVGSAYSQTLYASGGTAPYNWSIKTGQLPAGLSLSGSTGVISGKPTASGTANFTAMAMDSSSPTQGASLAMTIAVAASQVAPVTPPIQPAQLTIAASTLAAGTIGAAYSQTLSASGGTSPYSWAITSGQLPAGLSLSASTGAISGTASASNAAGGYNFAVTVTDSSNPAQTALASTSITLSATPLSITSSALAAGTDGTAYSQTLQATGGTPAYKWSISSGSLPAGLTLATTTGTISGMPTGSGASSFTATVTDNGIPAQSQSMAASITVSATQQASGSGTTWYIRPDGGTRYDANVTNGQCNGQANAAYPGTGVNQPCAFNDVRFLWDDQSYGNDAWVIAGGDTVYIFGCAANTNQPQSYSPHCRIGFDNNTGPGAGYTWCVGGNGPYSCFNPAIPAGTATNHTKIYGGCVLSGSCNTGNTTNRANLAVLFAGFGAGAPLNLSGTQYVDVQGLELTSHSQAVPGTNGICITHGSPSYPAPCSSGTPMSDYDSNGMYISANTANVTLTDVWIDGNSSSGIAGPIGANITLTRVQINFNGFAGWNFDDGSDDPNGPNASLALHYVTMEGNGCNQQWPITNPTFPAVSCYDLLSGGFGDSLSGQDAQLVSLTADHYTAIYNTKDGFIGPHTQIGTLTVTDSMSYANDGQQWKWGATNATFENNYTGGYYSLMAQIPGAAQNFNESTGLPGSYVSDYARAAGDVFSFYSTPGGSVLFANNTTVTYASTIFDENECSTGFGNCSGVVIKYINNINLGYTVPLNYYPGAGGEAPGLYYPSDTYIRQPSNNVEFGVRNGNCGNGGGTAMVCADPKLTNEPAQGSVPPESTLFNFNFYPASGSPVAGAGLSIGGIATDVYGVTRPSPPSIGAAEPQ